MLTLASRLDVMNRLGRALSDPTRSRILLRLLDEPGYPAALADELDLTRTNVSNHLACLRGCGIVVAVPEGRRTRYEIADRHLTRALDALVDVVLAVDDGETPPRLLEQSGGELATAGECAADCAADR
ncbi:helix-turn-helix transcriptional regulator [Curtobacterium sp. MCBD17_032]|uniref:Cd(II)/Pb(II)-sensing metalloregulatory transcriptional regulator CmtR n=1 Tax=Curtobacterium sp. MCBD17_032 TaxID=2175659 RepID=UPI000DA9D1E1|nr:metalloregulator ArsR/SmtB family transcription factor [Curtobacterium sp. MCBD17_032]PZE81765.1 transcriptional regulator [Curtobacterium sp. MCBD17_032]